MRPVSSRASTRVSAGSASSTVKWVRAGAGAAAADRALVGLAVVAAERRVDRPRARPRPTLDQGEVRAADLAALDHRREPPVGLVVAGDDHQPRGVAVEPVDDPRALGLAAPEQVAEHVDQGLAAVAGRRVDDEPGGLVDHREALVDPDQPRLGAHGGALAGGRRQARRARSRSRPAVIATSARLNAGHSGGSRKSVTAPVADPVGEVAERAAAEQADPQPQPGRRGVEREPGQDQRQRDRGEGEHEPVARPRRRARRRCRCWSPG